VLKLQELVLVELMPELFKYLILVKVIFMVQLIQVNGLQLEQGFMYQLIIMLY